MHVSRLDKNSSNDPAGRLVDRKQSVDSAEEWRSSLTWVVTGLLLFLSLSGLSILFLPFSIYQQVAVLLHVLLGTLLIVPIGLYVTRHERKRRSGNLSHYKLLGYLSGGALVVTVLTGLVETAQALFGTHLSRSWDQAHLISGFAVTLFISAHLLTLIVRRTNSLEVGQARRLSLIRSSGVALSGFLLCGVLAWQYGGIDFDESFSEGYDFKYGVDRPFAPSLARKDMSEAEATLRSEIVTHLNPSQSSTFLANLQMDPSEHAGLVTVAERLTEQMELTDNQRGKIKPILDEMREQYRSKGRVDPRRLAGSQSCGTSGCHSEILAEWEPSAHRYAAMDTVFQRVQEIMVDEKDPQSTRYCAGCHDPISLFAGAKNQENMTLSALGSDEGISCVSCHSIVQADVRGNADYTIRVQEPYLFEYHEGAFAKRVSDFLIRAYPRHHVEAYSQPLYKTTEFCAACHKQFIDEEVNDFGWVQGQNQYDSWRKSRWHQEGNAEGTLSCRECHMPLVTSKDPAKGDYQDSTRTPSDGKHRSHRTLGANQFIPLYHKLPGAEEQVKQIVEWLRGEYEVPEIAHKWTEGPVVRMSLSVPEEVRPGEAIQIRTHLTNNKTGHNFPTGPLDMIESWVELTVTDESGNLIYGSGTLDERDYLENPQIVFKKDLIDRDGNPVDRHNLWDAVGANYKRALFPGFTDTTDFNFKCPAINKKKSEMGEDPIGNISHAVNVPEEVSDSTLTVNATLWYSKFKAPFMDKVFPSESKVRAPATAITRATASIRVTSE